MSLVRAAWERRPEGPAYLPSTVMLLYLAGQCAYFSTHFLPSDHWHSEGFSRVPADGLFLQFLNFEIPDLSPLAIANRPLREDQHDPRSLRSFSCGPQAPSPPRRPKTTKTF